MSDVQIPSDVRVLIGSIYFTVSAALLVVTVLVMGTIVTSKKMRTSPTYLIICNILLAACIQLVVHGVGGVMAIANTKFVPELDKRLGAVAQLGWCTVNVLTFSLALNRLSIFTSIPLIKHLKCMAPTLVMIAFSWTCGAYFLVVLLTPDAALRFFPDKLQWDYDELPLRVLLTISERVIIVPAFGISFLIYLVICVKIWKQKSANRREVRLLIMAIVTFLDEALLFSIYQFGADILPDSPYSGVAANFHWILECGLHAIALLCVNSVIRDRIFSVVKTSAVFSSVGHRSSSRVDYRVY